MTDHHLPSDIFVIPDNATPAEVFQQLEAQVGNTFADRTDFLGLLAMQAKATEGPRGWRERVQLQLTEGGHQEVHTKMISDASKMFELFRLGGEQGFGWRREEMARYSVRHLRVFAQNAEWANRNRERVLEILTTVPTENEMRKLVQASIQAEKDGTDAPVPEVWENVVLRMSPTEASTLRMIMAGVQLKREQAMGETFSAKPGVANGQIVLAMAGEWYHASETFEGEDGEEVEVANSTFVQDAELLLKQAAEEKENLQLSERDDAHAAD